MDSILDSVLDCVLDSVLDCGGKPMDCGGKRSATPLSVNVPKRRGASLPAAVHIAAVHIALVLAGSLLGAEPAAKPFLRIEAGMHTAPIRRIATDAAGRVALTCSDDKTAKLWSLEKGKEGTLLRTFRLPIRDGVAGKLYACALSPDGSTAAVAGSEGEIYLLAATSGRHSAAAFNFGSRARSCLLRQRALSRGGVGR